MKIKKKYQTLEQIEYVFRSNLFLSNATLSTQQLPKDFGVLDISPDRGGKNTFSELTFSTFGNDNKRVMGISVWDDKEKLIKEDIYEYEKDKSIVSIYPRGLYQKANPLYKHTHHKTKP